MRVSEAQIRRLAGRIVEVIIEQGNVKPQVDKAVIEERVVAIILKSFEDEAAIEDEAERIAAANVRRAGGGVDESKMIQLIKRKLAEERNFPL